MAPNKKKERGKTSEWLECSLCGKLISQPDAELHSTSCSAQHGYIKDRVLHGKLLQAETLLGEDGTPVTKTLRDRDNAVWLAVPTMQLCGLSIGQPCVLGGKVVKRTWPHKLLPLANVALSQSGMQELSLAKDDFVSVERFTPDESLVVDSALLRLREDNPLFEKEEFATFAAGYLGGKYVTEGSPIMIRYFGQTCHCTVESLVWRRSAPTISPNPTHSLDTSASKTPTKIPGAGVTSPGTSLHTPAATSAKDALGSGDGNSCRSTHSSHSNSYSSNRTADESYSEAAPVADMSGHDLSDSLASLNISSPTSQLTSTPTSQSDRLRYPNLVTPGRLKQSFSTTPGYLRDAGDLPSPPPVFARVVSGMSILTVASGETEDENSDRTKDDKGQGSQLSLDDIGGLTSQIEELKTRILRAQQTSNPGARCILLHGPPGTGKSMLARTLTSHLGLHTTLINGTDIWSKLFGEAEANLRNIFKAAQDRSPSIIVIDDLDVICPKRSQNSSGQQEHRIVGTLLSLIDRITSKKLSSAPVIVVGITNNLDGLDPALRRAGRFGCEVEVPVPTGAQRMQILQCLLRRLPNCVSETELETVARNAHGYTGADLAALVNEASMLALGSERSEFESQSVSPLCVGVRHLVEAGVTVKPSALREIQLEVPQVRWSDIGGMSEVKMRLREAVELPLGHPDVYRGLGIEPPRGLLMYGPPGCSKTMVARALATECSLNFLAVKGPELFNQYVGESEKAIREVFRKARSAAPSVIFFDEIDAIAAKRGSSSGGSGVDDRVLTQLLTEMDGLEFLKDVFIMAATNRPDKIDHALLRPGRFDSLVYVPLPDASTRQEILQGKFARMAVDESVDLSRLVEATEGYSGAEVVAVCQEAGLCALRDSLESRVVSSDHFTRALGTIRPQVQTELLEVYQDFSQRR